MARKDNHKPRWLTIHLQTATEHTIRLHNGCDIRLCRTVVVVIRGSGADCPGRAQEVAMVLWAFAALRFQPDDAFLDALRDAVERRVWKSRDV